MKIYKNLLKLVLLSSLVCGLGQLNVTSNSFVDAGLDLLSENAISYRQIKKAITPSDEKVNRNAGNKATKYSSMLGVQKGDTTKNGKCLRFIIATYDEVDCVTFNRTLTYRDKSYEKQVANGFVDADWCYEEVEIPNGSITPKDFNYQAKNADYTRLFCYTMTNITQEDALLEVSVKIGDEEKYQSASLQSLSKNNDVKGETIEF